MIHVHFIGVGGTGLSAIAIVLLGDGYQVSGSDRRFSPLAEAVHEAGGNVFIGHHADHVQGADVVIRSSAVPDENIEVQAAQKAGIPVLKRRDFLVQLMRGRRGIAVAGTHGKTTTTAMIVWALTALNQDPTFIVGGTISKLGTNARAGQGELFVIEADEYDHMFLGLQPEMAVVTNVEHDHPDFYPTPQAFYDAFQKFIDLLDPDGFLLVCVDDPGASLLMKDASAKGVQTLTYGLEDMGYNYSASNLVPIPKAGYAFDALRDGTHLANIALEVPGEHNVRNALAALAIIDQLELSVEEAARSLGDFQGVGRRFELRGEAAGITVVDDYAHHPTEIRATLSAARGRYPDRDLWVVWQPHTYSRTLTLLDDFGVAFDQADHVIVTDIYPARETAPSDFNPQRVVDIIQNDDVHYEPDLGSAAGYLLENLEHGSVLLVLSAGDADQISEKVLADLTAIPSKVK